MLQVPKHGRARVPEDPKYSDERPGRSPARFLDTDKIRRTMVKEKTH
jgi:hypothetical protein